MMENIAKMFHQELDKEFWICEWNPMIGYLYRKGKFTKDKFLFSLPCLQPHQSPTWDFQENPNELYKLITKKTVIVEMIDTIPNMMKFDYNIENKVIEF